MNFSVDPQGQIVVVSTEVEKLDASNAPELKAHFLQLNKVGTNYIVLDMSKTKYCDSSGLSAVLIANRLCKDTNGKFAACNRAYSNLLKSHSSTKCLPSGIQKTPRSIYSHSEF